MVFTFQHASLKGKLVVTNPITNAALDALIQYINVLVILGILVLPLHQNAHVQSAKNMIRMML